MRKNLKIRSTNFELALGDINKNKETIKNLVKTAYNDGVSILSLPELSLTGASLYDGYKDMALLAEDAILELKEFSKGYNILFSVGFPLIYNRKIYNAIALLMDGYLVDLYTKKNLSITEKNVFASDIPDGEVIPFLDDWCEVNPLSKSISHLNIAVSIGEDEMMDIPRSLTYKSDIANCPQIILNPTAEVKMALNEEEILNRVRFLSKDVTYVYTSQGRGESTTDFVYGGLNIISEDGKVEKIICNDQIDYVNRYRIYTDQELLHFDKFEENITREKFPYLPIYEQRDDYVRDVLDIGASALLTRMQKIGVKNVFLGVSGGLDSTMALLFLVHAYNKVGYDLSGINCYTMPAFGTSDRTKSNAYLLCEALGLELKEINITEAVKIHLRDIGHDGITPDTAYENAQARERTQILFDLANMHNGIVIGTGDLSEAMQGFATFNGDQMSNYSLNASLTKTEIRYVVGAIAETTENLKLKAVLDDILDTPISPELISEDKKEISQKTEDIIGPYELIDFFIYEHLTYHLPAEEILEDAISAFEDKYDKETIKKWLISYFKRFTASQFKRSTAVDGPNITGRAFSPRAGFKIPSDLGSEGYLENLYEKN
ncbi:NAD(+) synthase [uncultured Anaerococcus sp.]|uniref:NAD(+) synthase n=1 Tax=uncultured Anaerococcus sp. TaxID=293428 RepID=UPI0026004989|nr:NAD(+) synthase [uncultured Anaerococcus sp.]